MRITFWIVEHSTPLAPGAYSNKLGCNHQKIFIIDDKIAFVGGINMDETHIDVCAHMRKD